LAVIAAFGDGKWHKIETIAERAALPVDRVLTFIQKRNWAGGSRTATAEIKRVARTHHIRIYRKDKAIASRELVERLGPLIDGLKAEGKKNMATISIAKIALIAGQLQSLVDEWSQ
jgi:hypothetical protein